MHVYSDVLPIDSPCPFFHDIQVIVLVCFTYYVVEYDFTMSNVYIYIQLNLYFALFFDGTQLANLTAYINLKLFRKN